MINWLTESKLVVEFWINNTYPLVIWNYIYDARTVHWNVCLVWGIGNMSFYFRVMRNIQEILFTYGDVFTAFMINIPTILIEILS